MSLVMISRGDVTSLPLEITRCVMYVVGPNLAPPKGWVERPGAHHMGRNKWMIPIEREVSGGQ